MNKLVVSVLALALFACSGTSTEESPKVTTFQKNECVTAGAVYRFEFKEISGSCGSLPTSLLHVPESGILNIEADCNLEDSTYKGCEVYTDIVCDDSKFTIKQVGKVVWEADGSGGKGQVTVTVVGQCISTYDLKATRL